MSPRYSDASTAPSPVAGGRRPARPVERPLSLRMGALWAAFRRQSPSFWFISFFLFIEYVRPQAIYESIAVVPWGKLSLGGAVLLAMAEGKLAFREKGLWILIAIFTVIILASSAQAYDTSLAFSNLNVWIIWLLAMAVIAASCGTRTQLILTFVLWFLWNFKMSQSAFRSWAMDGFRFRDWGVSGAPGWFGNSGEFGIEMCVFLPIVGYFTVGMWPTLSRWQRITMALVSLSALVGAVGSSSRGALLGMGAIGIWVMLRSPHRLRAVAITVALAGMTWLILPEESKARWRDAGDDKTSQSRLQYWKDGLKIASEYPVLGIGYKSWLPYYRDHYNPHPELPHNLFIECMVELGYVGLFVFLLLVGGTFWQNAQTRKRTGKLARAPDRLAYNLAFGLDGALIGYLASGFFITVFFYPFFWINLGFTIALSRYASSRRGVATAKSLVAHR